MKGREMKVEKERVHLQKDAMQGKETRIVDCKTVLPYSGDIGAR